MQDETENMYELWDEVGYELPPHSHLYHLAPIGVGSPFVESLTSYVTRLAEAHSIYPRVLVSDKIAPLLKQSYLCRSLDQNGCLFPYMLTVFWEQSPIVNGLTTWAEDWVQTLERLTLRHDLRFLTMLTWRHVLSSRRLLRRTQVWCPLCYEQRREAGLVVYQPLLWALKVTHVCPQHNLPLQQQCPYPDCGRKLPLLASRALVGYCAWCERWLGYLRQVDGERQPHQEGRERQWQAAQTVGEILAIAPSLQSLPNREVIAATITAYLNEAVDGNAAELARRLQVHPSCIMDWRRGQTIPELGTLLHICSSFEIPLLSFLTGNAVEIATPQKRVSSDLLSVARPKRILRNFDTDGVRNSLESLLQSTEDPPRSLRAIAADLGYASSFLYGKFPELCKAIAARHREGQKKKSIERTQRLCDEIRQVTLDLHKQGYYPGNKRVSKLLKNPMSLIEPEVHATWKATLQQLGLRR